LTIKLTQHVPVGSRQGPYRTSDGGSCIPPLRILQGGMRLFNANFWRGTHTYAAWRGKFAFPQNATLEQNLRFLRYANLEIRATQCLLPSVVKDRSFRSTVSDRNVSAPGGARIRFGAEPAKKNGKNF